jgi:hypothetical protein
MVEGIMAQDETYLSAQKVVQARRGLYAHATVYAIVNTALFIIDYLTPGGPWFFWPLVGWGVALVINAVVVFAGLTPGSEAEERAIRRYLDTHPRQS